MNGNDGTTIYSTEQMVRQHPDALLHRHGREIGAHIRKYFDVVGKRLDIDYLVQINLHLFSPHANKKEWLNPHSLRRLRFK